MAWNKNRSRPYTQNERMQNNDRVVLSAKIVNMDRNYDSLVKVPSRGHGGGGGGGNTVSENRVMDRFNS
jgi:hypothetical protein